MAKEQKAIAIWYKNGKEIEFERFTIKTLKKILSSCVNLYAENLSLFKEILKEFDSFVIYSTDSYGENKVVEMELTDREFLNLVKEHYKDYNGVYPNEDKFDSERWLYIMSGHSFKENRKSIKKSLKEKTFNGEIDIKIVYWDDTPSEYWDDVTNNELIDLKNDGNVYKIIDVTNGKKKTIYIND